MNHDLPCARVSPPVAAPAPAGAVVSTWPVIGWAIHHGRSIVVAGPGDIAPKAVSGLPRIDAGLTRSSEVEVSRDRIPVLSVPGHRTPLAFAFADADSTSGWNGGKDFGIGSEAAAEVDLR